MSVINARKERESRVFLARRAFTQRQMQLSPFDWTRVGLRQEIVIASLSTEVSYRAYLHTCLTSFQTSFTSSTWKGTVECLEWIWSRWRKKGPKKRFCPFAIVWLSGRPRACSAYERTMKAAEIGAHLHRAWFFLRVSLCSFWFPGFNLSHFPRQSSGVIPLTSAWCWNWSLHTQETSTCILLL